MQRCQQTPSEGIAGKLQAHAHSAEPLRASTVKSLDACQHIFVHLEQNENVTISELELEVRIFIWVFNFNH